MICSTAAVNVSENDLTRPPAPIGRSLVAAAPTAGRGAAATPVVAPGRATIAIVRAVPRAAIPTAVAMAGDVPRRATVMATGTSQPPRLAMAIAATRCPIVMAISVPPPRTARAAPATPIPAATVTEAPAGGAAGHAGRTVVPPTGIAGASRVRPVAAATRVARRVLVPARAHSREAAAAAKLYDAASPPAITRAGSRPRAGVVGQVRWAPPK